MDLRINLAAILISLFIYNHGKISWEDDYKPVFSHDSDFRLIKNCDNYEYWECIYNPSSYISARDKQQTVAQVGNKKYSKYANKIFSATGFITGCGPGVCSYYIVAVRRDKSIKVINTPNDFRNFIGNIDNLEEAKLSARNGGYVFSVDPEYKTMYQESTHSYIFKLYDFGLQSCIPMPQNKPKLITLKIDKQGSIARL